MRKGSPVARDAERLARKHRYWTHYESILWALLVGVLVYAVGLGLWCYWA